MEEVKPAARKEKDPVNAAMRISLWHLGRSAKTRKQMREILEKKEYTPQVVETVLDRLEGYGYINDAELARREMMRQVQGKGAGKGIVRQRLYKIGVPPEVARETLADLPPSQEYAAARKTGERLYARLTNEEPRARRQKIWQGLCRKGFSSDIASQVARELETQWEEDE